MLGGIRKSSFSNFLPKHLHLSFSWRRIKHHWWRMRKRRSNAFFNIWVLFRYLYVLPLQESSCLVFWFMPYVANRFVSWTHLFIVNYYGQWLTHPYLCFDGHWLTLCSVYFQFGHDITHKVFYFLVFFLILETADVLYFAMERLAIFSISFKCGIAFCLVAL